MSARESVKVAVRLRPLSSKERQYKEIIDIDQSSASVFIASPQGSKVQFTYDFAFPPCCTQEEVYELTSAPIIDGALQGFNGTIFAYGQTGTGKTHTMDGAEEGEHRGIVPRAFEHIFEYIKVNSDSQTFAIQIQYIEIYNEAIRDLLSDKDPTGSLVIREDPEKGFYVADVTIKEVKSIQELFRLQAEGKRRRKTRKTGMNDESSRSHSVLTLTIETLMSIEGRQHVRTARLNLVDLAGSERVAKTGAEGQGFTEGVSINYALMVLGNCISALTSRGHSHIPYRDSSLTKLLRDSLGGNARTLMIATLGPADYNFSESMSTLRYAENAKKIKNKPKVNMDPKDALLLQLKEEKEALEAQLRGTTPEQQNADREAQIKALEAAHEREKKRLTDESHLAAEERAALETKLEAERQEIEKAKAEQAKFAGRLKELTRFLAKGSDKLKEKTQKNETEIAAIRAKLAKREERALQIQRELEEKKAKKQQMMEQCTTIQAKVGMVSE
jgi:kinesin family protein 3/17